jgi:Alkylmercury lyase
MAPADLDKVVRHRIYAALANAEPAPSPGALARALEIEIAEVRAALERLHAAHALALCQRTRDVRMAFPFANRPTSYRVESDGRAWDANCAWDALSIVRLLKLRDARILDQGGPRRSGRWLIVVDGRLVERDGVISFPRPAWRWWEDIVFT